MTHYTFTRRKYSPHRRVIAESLQYATNDSTCRYCNVVFPGLWCLVSTDLEKMKKLPNETTVSSSFSLVITRKKLFSPFTHYHNIAQYYDVNKKHQISLKIT